MTPEKNFSLDNEGMREDRMSEKMGGDRFGSDRRPGYGGAGKANPAKGGLRLLGISLGWWTAGIMTVAVICLAFYGYYSVFNQDAMTNPNPAAPTADAPNPDAAKLPALGDATTTSSENLNREVMNNLTSDKSAPFQGKLQSPAENQNLPPALADKSLLLKPQPPVKTVPMPIPPNLAANPDAAMSPIESPPAPAAKAQNPAIAKKAAPNPSGTQANTNTGGANAAGGDAFPASAWAIQLLASHKQEAIKAAWPKLQKQYTALAPLKLRIESVTRGDNDVIYRLQAGPFTSRQLAEHACETLASDGQSCLVVRPQLR